VISMRTSTIVLAQLVQLALRPAFAAQPEARSEAKGGPVLQGTSQGTKAGVSDFCTAANQRTDQDRRLGIARQYNQILERKIEDCWLPLDDSGAQVRFHLSRTGAVSHLSTMGSSGTKKSNAAAIKAIKAAQPLPAAPRELKAPSFDAICDFHYSQRKKQTSISLFRHWIANTKSTTSGSIEP